MTIEQFGQSIKIKYPQYAGLSDLQVGQKMLSKFPQYQTQITETKKETDLLEKITKVVTTIFPGEKFGEAIGTQIAKARAKPEEKQFITPGPTGKELTGEALKTGAFLGSVALGGGGIVAQAGRLAGLGAAGAAGEALTQDKTLAEIAKNALLGGLMGGAIGGATGLIGKGVQKIISKAPEQLYNNVLRITQKIEQSGKSPSKFLLENKIWGDLGSIRRQSQIEMDEANQIINNKLSSITKKIDGQDIFNEASKIIKGKYGSIMSGKEITELLNKIQATGLRKGTEISLQEANRIRQQLDHILGDRFFMAQQNPVQKEAMGAIANSLRKTIQSLSGTQGEFNKLANFLRTHQLTEKAIAVADKKYGLGMLDLITAGGGLAGAGPVGAVGAVAGRKILGRADVQTGVAQILNKLKDIKTDTAGRISKTAVLKIIESLSNQRER